MPSDCKQQLALIESDEKRPRVAKQDHLMASISSNEEILKQVTELLDTELFANPPVTESQISLNHSIDSHQSGHQMAPPADPVPDIISDFLSSSSPGLRNLNNPAQDSGSCFNTETSEQFLINNIINSTISTQNIPPVGVNPVDNQHQNNVLSSIFPADLSPSSMVVAGQSSLAQDTPRPMVTNAGATVTTVSSLPADLQMIDVKGFLPVASHTTGNIDPHRVYQTANSVQANNPPEAGQSSRLLPLEQSPFSTDTAFTTSNNSSFPSVSISDSVSVAMADLGTLKSGTDTKPKVEIPDAGGLKCDINNSMLRRMLTGEVENSSPSPSPASSPENPLESPSSMSSPSSFLHEAITQSTLIQKSEKLHLNSDTCQDDDPSSDLWNCFPEEAAAGDVPNKVHKASRDADAHSSMMPGPISVDKLFDAGGAVSTTSFEFTKFGSDISGVFTFGSSSTTTVSTSATDTRAVSSLLSNTNPGGESLKSVAPPVQKPTSHARKSKEPGLSTHFPAKAHGYELRIMSQPEEQHRARYLTEGSRGAVKDRTGQGYPKIKLNGYNEPVTLQIFIGNETGRVKPHGFYQGCKVCGKNSSTCSEREIEGTFVIETELSPLNDMVASIDCVGILKLRNADVEKRIGVAKARAKKKNSTRARMIFRTTFQKPDGTFQTLQALSTPILCTQPVGQPEVCRMSLHECSVNGGESLFIIGKNFLKGTQVFFQEVTIEDGNILWEKEADIDAEYFQQTHLICTVPEYQARDISKPVQVQIVVICRGKMSDPQEFTYKPLLQPVKQEVPMETDEGQSKGLQFGVSPEALKLNRMVEQQQNSPASTSTSMFQLPPGTVPGIVHMTTNSTAQRDQSSTQMVTDANLASAPLRGASSQASPVIIVSNASATASSQMNLASAPAQTSPMIVILPRPTSSAPTLQNTLQDTSNVEALLKSILGNQSGQSS